MIRIGTAGSRAGKLLQKGKHSGHDRRPLRSRRAAGSPGLCPVTASARPERPSRVAAAGRGPGVEPGLLYAAGGLRLQQLLMLGLQTGHQFIVLRRLQTRWKRYGVGAISHLRTLHIQEITHLNQRFG